MITDYVPTVDNVLELFFSGEADLKDVEDLRKGLETKGIALFGGVLVGKLLVFLTSNSKKLYLTNQNEKSWHTICIEITDLITVRTNSNHTLAHQICWLAEILFRYLVNQGNSEASIRRQINEN